MEDGGALSLTLEVEAGRVAAARLDSTRPASLHARFVGRAAAGLPDLAARLHALCGMAQSVAARAAVEAALGVDPGPERRTARAFLTLAEAADGHLWHLLMDAAPYLGEKPEPAPLRRLRAAAATLREETLDPAGAEPVLDAVAESVAALLPSPLPTSGTEDDVMAWAADRRTQAQRLMALALRRDHARFGRSPVPAQPELPAEWYAARLSADRGFGACPTLDGAPAEPGPLARRAAEPMVSALLARHGNGLAARVAARLAEVATVPARLRALAAGLRPGAPPELPEGSGEGCGVADTARGRLAHWVRVERGVIRDWRVSAPTEWAFHPAGAMVRGVVGAEASPDLAAKVGLLVLALDPCVPCRVQIAEPVHA